MHSFADLELVIVCYVRYYQVVLLVRRKIDAVQVLVVLCVRHHSTLTALLGHTVVLELPGMSKATKNMGSKAFQWGVAEKVSTHKPVCS